MTHLDLASLKRLLEAGSARPWTFEYEHPPTNAHGGGQYHIDGPGGCLSCDPSRADAALIVAAVNALPNLIAIAEAAQAWRDKSVHTFDANCSAGDHDDCTEAAYLDELRDALSTLSTRVAP